MSELSARERRVQVWERHSTIPLAVLALIYLGLYAVEVLADQSELAIFDFVVVSDIIWAIFIADFLGRLF